MRNLESRGNKVSEFLKKITEAKEKCWEDLSRTPGAMEVLQAKLGKSARKRDHKCRERRKVKRSLCRELSQ